MNVKQRVWYATGRVPGPSGRGFRAVEAGPFAFQHNAAAEGRRKRFGGLKVVPRDELDPTCLDQLVLPGV